MPNRRAKCSITPLALNALRRCCLVETRNAAHSNSVLVAADRHLDYLVKRKLLAIEQVPLTVSFYGRRATVTKRGWQIAAQHITVNNNINALDVWTRRDRAIAQNRAWGWPARS